MNNNNKTKNQNIVKTRDKEHTHTQDKHINAKIYKQEKQNKKTIIDEHINNINI